MPGIHRPSLIPAAFRATTRGFQPYRWAFPIAFVTFVASQELERLPDVRALPPKSLVLLCLGLLVLYLLQSLSKANILQELSLARERAISPGKTGGPLRRPFSALLRSSFAIEASFVSLFLVSGAVLALPVFIASRYSPEASSLLTALSLSAGILLFLFLLLIREVTYLYAVLAGLQRSSALESSFILLVRHARPLLSLLVGALLSFFIFTIVFNTAMLMSVPGRNGAVLQNVAAVALEAWFLVFWQALWLEGFHRIAKEPEAPEPSEPVEEAPSPAA